MKTNLKRTLALLLSLTCCGAAQSAAVFAEETETNAEVSIPVLPLGTYEPEELEGQKVWTSIYENTIKGEYSGQGFLYQTAETFTFNIEVEKEGMYSISSRCAQILSQDGRMATISVNDVDYTYVVPYLDTWTDVNFGVFRFKEGVNTITFKPQYGYQAYDTVTFAEADLPELKGTGIPCDPDATPEARSLLAYLNSVYGSHILAGQQEIYGGGHPVSTTIRYDASTNTCVDSNGKTYTFDEADKDTADDGSVFVWHCKDETGQVYDYNTQNRNYTYNDYNYEIKYLEKLTGKSPAIHGYDFGSYCPCYAWDDGVTERMIDWATNKNGIVTASWHINVPKAKADYTLGEPLDFNSTTYTNVTDFSPANCMVEGTMEYDYFKLCMENLAKELLQLQEAKVPVLFRPFHEAEGNGGANGQGAWFWWSKEGAEVYNQLWIYLYDTLTKEYGLHNLIWEQNLYAWSSDSALWYTGDDYVDIVGFDKYNTVYNRHDGKKEGPNEDAESKIFYSLVDYVGNRKMVAMPENSTVPSLENLLVEKAGWLYFCPWYDSEQDPFLSGTQYQNADTLKEMYLSDYCITLDELPKDLYSGNFETETNTETGTEPSDEILYGDSNESGSTEIGDVILVCKTVMGAASLTENGQRNSDVDLSGVVDATDASLILQAIVKLITLPVEK